MLSASHPRSHLSANSTHRDRVRHAIEVCQHVVAHSLTRIQPVLLRERTVIADQSIACHTLHRAGVCRTFRRDLELAALQLPFDVRVIPSIAQRIGSGVCRFRGLRCLQQNNGSGTGEPRQSFPSPGETEEDVRQGEQPGSMQASPVVFVNMHCLGVDKYVGGGKRRLMVLYRA